MTNNSHTIIFQQLFNLKKKNGSDEKSILTVSCGLKRQRPVRKVAMIKTERLGSEVCL